MKTVPCFKRMLAVAAIFMIGLVAVAQEKPKQSAPKSYLEGIDLSSIKKSYEDCESGKLCFFSVSGEITHDSVELLKRRFSIHKPGTETFVLFDSVGGDIYAAMQMGEFLRSRAPITGMIMPNATCASACVFALLGATTRSVAGSVGIHRPYNEVRAQSKPSLNAERLKNLDRDARAFLERMNVSTALYDEMLRYSSDGIYFMTADEMSRFRVAGTDYVWQDRSDTEQAAKLGISKQALFQRRSLAKEKCKLPEDGPDYQWAKCWQQTLQGK